VRARRQRFPDRLLDDARAGEANERLRLGDGDVTQAPKGGEYAAGGGVSEDSDVREAGLVVAVAVLMRKAATEQA
jgi:hypothetical protein